MSCDCKLNLVADEAGVTLDATITGDFSWIASLRYPGLPMGDVEGKPGDTNPIASFQLLLKQFAAAMSSFGLANESPTDPNVLEYCSVDRVDVSVFQTLLWHAGEALIGIGVRLGAGKAGKKKFNAGKVAAAWKKAQASHKGG